MTARRPEGGAPGPGAASQRAELRQRPDATGPPAAATKSRHDLPAVSGHQDALDGLRAIAAFAVLVVHVGGQTGFEYSGTPASWAVSRGDIGVPIFFALSGLLLFRPWARAILQGTQAPQVGPYLWRRALRILPAYWAVVLIALPTLDAAHAGSPWTWAQYLFLLQIYNPHPWWPGTGATGLAQMWSLSVEVSFYLALPLIAAALGWLANRAGGDVNLRAKRLLAGIAGLAASSVAFIVVIFHPEPQFWLGETLPRMTAWFAAGMTIAVITVWAQAEPGREGPVRRFCWTVGFSSGACWINRVMRFLGRISYGVFLWQFIVIYAFFNALHMKDGFHGGSYSAVQVIGILIAIALLTAAVSTVGYFCIERPAQRLYRLALRQRQGRHAQHMSARNTATPLAHGAVTAARRRGRSAANLRLPCRRARPVCGPLLPSAFALPSRALCPSGRLPR